MTERILTNARLVLADTVMDGTLVVSSDGTIAAIEAGRSGAPGALDLEGEFLIPGLVELHTDNLEKHVTPRPGVRWPAVSAVIAHDGQVAAAGITTVFDALALGDVSEKSDRLATLDDMATGIAEGQATGALRAEHFLHLRCEVSSADAIRRFEHFADWPLVRLVSVMDHTPGQRQFVHLSKYAEYYQAKFRMSDEQLAAFIADRRADQERWSAPNRRAIADGCRARGLALASHDDATTAHVAEASEDGCMLAEFPTTLEAAEECRRRDIAILGGAPNLLRGGSHSGNVSVGDLARRGLLDILSSDYAPVSLLQAAFALGREQGGEHGLPAAIATVTSTPAARAGLADRGALAPGLRADLVRVAERGGWPVVRGVWKAGERIA